ncbi:MAG: tyrosine-type recombinase/integrase [Synergistaceae bacterium]|nr:tyrosine-type recombinase/integrase [Synergistaceae bacterium]
MKPRGTIGGTIKRKNGLVVPFENRIVVLRSIRGDSMLTDKEVRALQPTDTRYMRSIGDGLYIEVVPAGHKYWWLSFKKNNKRRKFLLGKYPDLSLKEAKIACTEKRRSVDISLGDVPNNLKFSELVWDWYKIKIAPKSPSYSRTVDGRIRQYVLPPFVNRFASDIKPREITAVIKAIQETGYIDTSHRILSIYRRVFRYAIGLQSLVYDPTSGIGDVIISVRHKHMASVTDPRDVADLMTSIYYYRQPKTRNAMLFSAYTFCRPGEIRRALWSEIDFARAEWRIPPERIKKRRIHVVPLSKQSIAVLESQKAILEAAGNKSQFVFPSERGPHIPMSADTVRVAIRSLGFGPEQMTAHGFRSMASTILNESGLWSADAIERQLAHVPGNDDVRFAYNYAQYLPERIKMMQWYADYLDGLREGK